MLASARTRINKCLSVLNRVLEGAWTTVRGRGQLAFVDRPTKHQAKCFEALWMELWRIRSSGYFPPTLTEVFQQNAWTQHLLEPARYRQIPTTIPVGNCDNCVLKFDSCATGQEIRNHRRGFKTSAVQASEK
ncbi:hypothetical protein CLF_113318 [Clonorchis sinensis]|uniref:Uncharacterized protein n=1 Tax=Clonorchis sinensis TaxID=79923 RepID=G7YY60_CLOSI|nr:hypothetical protein CLF_113318 [Clonorchis sinensis]